MESSRSPRRRGVPTQSSPRVDPAHGQRSPSRPFGARRSKAQRLGFLAAAGLVAASLLAHVSASAAVPSPDGLSQATAAASCWEIKQLTPAAPSGLYWLNTPTLGSAAQFHCDQDTDGGGWVLVGRGREGWSESNEGQGTAA